MSERDDAPVPRPARPSLKQRLTAQFDQYGPIAIATYLTLSVLAILGFSIAIWVGAEPSTATGVFGVLIAGWLLAKATMPIRILATLALTPGIAMILTRRRRSAAPAASELPRATASTDAPE